MKKSLLLTSSALANCVKCLLFGDKPPVSQRETEDVSTPHFSATFSCDSFLNSRNALILFPRDFYTIVSDYYHKNKEWDKEVFLNRFQNKLDNEEFRKEFLRNYKRELKEKFY